jgi:hypothetical protein
MPDRKTIYLNQTKANSAPSQHCPFNSRLHEYHFSINGSSAVPSLAAEVSQAQQPDPGFCLYELNGSEACMMQATARELLLHIAAT